MSLILHIVIALASLVITGITAFVPTQRRLVATYVSIVLTVATGVLLAALNHALILHVCMSGLTYLAMEVVGVMYSVAKVRRNERRALLESL